MSPRRTPRVGLRVCLVVAWAMSVSWGACGPAVPTPDSARDLDHPRGSYAVVPYPPPAPLVEILPARPAPKALWVDGQWRWTGETWMWNRGGWVRPPDGAVYVRWNSYYDSDGTLYFAPGTWRRRDGSAVRAAVIAPATRPPTERTAEEATQL